jgi:two-component system CAI-1 autoinducer sensor kinase/phosphatase CqsS
LLIATLPASTAIYFAITGLFVASVVSPLLIINHEQVVAFNFIAEIMPIAYGVIGVVLIFIIKKGSEKTQRRLHSNASFVAHEAITPLSVMSMVAQSFEGILNTAAKKDGNDTISISKKDWRLLRELTQNLNKSSLSGIKRVTTILNSRNNNYPDIGCYQAAEIISEILEEFREYEYKIEFKDKNDFFTYCSKEGIQAVISNIIRNAIKYAGEHAKIKIYLEKDSKIIIEDNGFGMSEEIRKNIFSEGITTSGHGYGLSICKKIIDDHNGSIICKSKIDEGAKFTIQL